MHLIPLLGDKRLGMIQTEDVQRLESAMGDRAPKTVNNVLTALSVMLRTAVEWQVIERIPCTIKLLKTPKNAAGFHDFDEYERLVEATNTDRRAQLVVRLGGEAGLRCGKMMALEWSDVDLNTRQLCVARSEWKGHVTVPKGSQPRVLYERLSSRKFPATSASFLRLVHPFNWLSRRRASSRFASSST